MSIKLKGSTDGSVTLQAPADTSPTGTDKTFTLPTKDGDAGQILKTDGSGALSFTDNLASSRNLVINGAMNVAQRGTANVTSVGYQTVDKFRTDASGGTFSQERINLTSSDSPYPLGFRHAFRVKNSAVASASNHYRQFETRIEAQDVVKSGWNYNSTSSYITVSFWARSSVAGTFTFDFRTQDSPAQAYPTSITLAANTWKKFELTYPGDSSIVIADDTGAGLRLVWGVYFGSDYTDSNAVMDAWHGFSSLNIAPDDTAGWGTTLNATFDVTGVQCEVSEKATKFEHRSYGDELARCQRYFYKIAGNSSDQVSLGLGYCYKGNNTDEHVRLTIFFPVTMRTGPSYSHSGIRGLIVSSTEITSNSSSSLDTSIYSTGIDVGFTSSSLATYNAIQLRLHNTADSHLSFSADL